MLPEVWHTSLYQTSNQQKRFSWISLAFYMPTWFFNNSKQLASLIYQKFVMGFSFLTNFRWKRAVGRSLEMLLASMMDDIFQLNNSKTLHSKENGRLLWFEKDLHLAWKQNSKVMMGFWSEELFRRMMVFKISDCFIIKEICSYHAIGTNSSPECYLSLWKSYCWISFISLGPKHGLSECAKS